MFLKYLVMWTIICFVFSVLLLTLKLVLPWRCHGGAIYFSLGFVFELGKVNFEGRPSKFWELARWVLNVGQLNFRIVQSQLIGYGPRHPSNAAAGFPTVNILKQGKAF